VSVTLVECVFVADVPVIVSVNVPAGVAVAVVTVSVELAPALTEDGLNVPLAPAGKPASESATVCAFPEVTCVATL